MLDKVMKNIRTNDSIFYTTDGRISETAVYTINPEHAAETVQDNEMVARASGLGWFGDGSGFVAVGRDANVAHCGLRGVLKGAEGAPR